MGQSWWWVVLVVVVVALLVAVAVILGRRRRAGASPSANAEIAAAAAGGVAGAAGAAAVVTTRAAEDAPEPAADRSGPDAGSTEPDEESPTASGADDEDLPRASAEPAATAAAEADEADAPGASAADGGAGPGAGVPDTPEAGPGTAQALAEEHAGPAAAAGAPEGDGVEELTEPTEAGAVTPSAGAAASIPAPREEQPLPPAGSSGEPPERPEPRVPEPAGSALAALDSGFVGPASTFAAAAAAVSAAGARPGPYPGSLLPAADGSNPSPDHRVKANEGSRRYHTPDSPFYQRTRGDAWFRTADEARAAGFTAWNA